VCLKYAKNALALGLSPGCQSTRHTVNSSPGQLVTQSTRHPVDSSRSRLVTNRQSTRHKQTSKPYCQQCIGSPNFLAVVFKKQKNSQQVVTRMQVLTRVRPIPQFTDTSDTDYFGLLRYRYRVPIPIPGVI